MAFYTPAKEQSKWMVEGVDINIVEKLIRESYQKAEKLAGKDVILFLGATGAGKSTTINYLMGCKIVRSTSLSGDDVAEVASQTFATIGHSAYESQTLFPEGFQSVLMPDVYLCDSPGFHDTRSQEMAICTAVSMEILLSKINRVKGVVLVIDKHTMTVDRGTYFRKLLITLNATLQFSPAIIESICLVITKADPKKTTVAKLLDLVSQAKKKIHSDADAHSRKNRLMGPDAAASFCDEDARQEFSEKSEEYMAAEILVTAFLNNPSQIHLIDVFDDGLSRQELLKIFSRFHWIDKQLFRFAKFHEERVKFENAILNFAHLGTEIIQKQITLPKAIDEKQSLIGLLQQEVSGFTRQIDLLQSITGSDKFLTEKEQLNDKIIAHQQEIQRIQKTIEADIARIHAEVERKISAVQLEEAGEIKVCEDAIRIAVKNLREKLDELTTRERIAYRTIRVDFERESSCFSCGETLQEFHYQDTPFSYHKVEIKHGKLVKEVINQQQGRYTAVIQTTGPERCTGQIIIYVEKQLLPENVGRISALRTQINTAEGASRNAQLVRIKDDNSAKIARLRKECGGQIEMTRVNHQKAIQKIEESIQACQTRLQAIARVLNGEEKHEQIRSQREQIKKCQASILHSDQQYSQFQEALLKLEKLCSELDTSEPIEIWRETSTVLQTWGFYKPEESRTTLRYDGQPYKEVKLEPKYGFIVSQNSNPANGKYEVVFQRERDRDGSITATIYIEKRYQTLNKSTIENLKKQIAEQRTKIEENRKNRLQFQTTQCNAEIMLSSLEEARGTTQDNLLNIVRYRENIDENTKRIAKLQEETSELKQQLRVVQQQYQRRKAFFAVIVKISEDIEFSSSDIADFRKVFLDFDCKLAPLSLPAERAYR